MPDLKAICAVLLLLAASIAEFRRGVIRRGVLIFGVLSVVAASALEPPAVLELEVAGAFALVLGSIAAARLAGWQDAALVTIFALLFGSLNTLYALTYATIAAAGVTFARQAWRGQFGRLFSLRGERVAVALAPSLLFGAILVLLRASLP